MDKKNHKLWAYIAVAALIVAVTAFSIKWPNQKKLLGDEYTGKIYNYDTYKILCCDIVFGNPRVVFNPANRYIDEFTFTYDESTGSYLICKPVQGQTLYLCIDSEPKLTLTESSDDYGCRWNVVRIGNTMYYMIVNADGDCAIALENSLDAVLVPYDENDTTAYVRFQ